MRHRHLVKFCTLGFFALSCPLNLSASVNAQSNQLSNSNCNNVKIDIEIIKGIHFDGVGGFNQVLTIQPEDSNSAIFSIKCGLPYQRFRLVVSDNNESMVSNLTTTHSSDNVELFNYRFGGSLTKDGYGTLNRYGSLSDIRLGASVKIKSKNQKNFYATRPEIRVEFL